MGSIDRRRLDVCIIWGWNSLKSSMGEISMTVLTWSTLRSSKSIITCWQSFSSSTGTEDPPGMTAWWWCSEGQELVESGDCWAFKVKGYHTHSPPPSQQRMRNTTRRGEEKKRRREEKRYTVVYVSELVQRIFYSILFYALSPGCCPSPLLLLRSVSQSAPGGKCSSPPLPQ